MNQNKGLKYIARLFKVFGISFITIMALFATKYGANTEAIKWGHTTIGMVSWLFLLAGGVCAAAAYIREKEFKNIHAAIMNPKRTARVGLMSQHYQKQTIELVIEVRRHYRSKIRRIDIFLEWAIICSSWIFFGKLYLGASLIVFMFCMALVRQRADSVWSLYNKERA